MTEPNLTRRDELLLKMYDQMFNDINRHILVVWQSVSVLIGAFAIFALTEKQVVTIDVAIALILLLVTWLLAHLLDAGYWYNRNLAIIANIERHFLLKSDLKNIHYYFGAHRTNNKMLTHLRIQRFLGVGIGILLVLFHVMTRIVPGFSLEDYSVDAQRILPYLALLVGTIYLTRLNKNRDESFQEFLRESPGIPIDTQDVSYGVGHGVG